MKTYAVVAILFVCGLVIPPHSHAEAMTVEIINVYHRPAAEIAPVVEPTLVPGGSISAYESKLIVKTTSQNLLEVKKLVKSLDTPTQQLMIQVRQGAVSKAGQTELIGPLPIIHSSDSDKSETLQNIKVLNGSRAMIHIGTLFPTISYYYTTNGFVGQGTTYRENTTGFFVRPQMVGNKVRLQLSTTQKSPGRHLGMIGTEQIQSTVTAPLGQWVAIGGTSKNSRYKGYFIFFGTKAYREIDTAIFVKVERVKT